MHTVDRDMTNDLQWTVNKNMKCLNLSRDKHQSCLHRTAAHTASVGKITAQSRLHHHVRNNEDPFGVRTPA